MEIILVNKDKNSMEVELPGTNETVLSPLVEALLDDPKVEFATSLKGHPLLERPTLYVRVTSGKPQTAFKRAATKVSNQYKDALEEIERLVPAEK